VVFGPYAGRFFGSTVSSAQTPPGQARPRKSVSIRLSPARKDKFAFCETTAVVAFPKYPLAVTVNDML
jgi:hypothetical protein